MPLIVAHQEPLVRDGLAPGLPKLCQLAISSYDPDGTMNNKRCQLHPSLRLALRTLFLLAACILFASLLAACQGGIPALEATPSPPPATATPLPATLPAADPYSGAGFDAFLAELEGSLLRDRPALVTRYMAQLPAGPLTDGDRAIFLWQGTARSGVQVVGDMNSWDPAGGLPLRRIEGSDLWVGEARYEPDARLDYKFVVDGGTWLLDPLNPRTMLGGFGPNSELAMPAYQPPPELTPAAGEIPAGTLTEHTLESSALGQTRTFFVYQPASQLIGAKLPSVYIHDGGEYISLIDAPAILDRLIADGAIPPLVAVFIPPVNRTLEYAGSEAYITFLAEELVPFVQATYDTDPSPAQTANVGASLGGLLAVAAAVSRPGVFGLAGGYSGAYSVGGDAVIGALRRAGPLPLRLYLAVGIYELAVSGDPDEGNLLAANQRLVQVLQADGYDYVYVETSQGHSWGQWRDFLGDGLRFLYGGQGPAGAMSDE